MNPTQPSPPLHAPAGRERRPMCLVRLALLIGVVAVGAWFGGWIGAPTWRGVKAKIASDFPEVASVTPDRLADWLSDPARPQPLLVDVRTREEFEVSHLPGAVWAEGDEAVRKALAGVPDDRPVVLYCAVGWRAANAADHLRTAGRTHVFNLEGSIFQWANEGRPVERGGEVASKVHPVNRRWGRLLDRKYRWKRDG